MGDAAAITERLETCFRQVHAERMDGIPILNDALEVRAVGMDSWNGFWLGVLITPWFMNIVLLPQEPEGETIPIGEKRLFGFPAGSFEFIRGHEPGLGPFWMCSLFSPMFEFTDMETVEATAEAALKEVLENEGEDASEDRDMQKIWRGELPEAEASAEADGDVSRVSVSATDDVRDTSPPVAVSRRKLLTGNLREKNP